MAAVEGPIRLDVLLTIGPSTGPCGQPEKPRLVNPRLVGINSQGGSGCPRFLAKRTAVPRGVSSEASEGVPGVQKIQARYVPASLA